MTNSTATKRLVVTRNKKLMAPSEIKLLKKLNMRETSMIIRKTMKIPKQSTKKTTTSRMRRTSRMKDKMRSMKSNSMDPLHREIIFKRCLIKMAAFSLFKSKLTAPEKKTIQMLSRAPRQVSTKSTCLIGKKMFSTCKLMASTPTSSNI